ncbi:MAG: hypothetical protein JJU37_16720 [Balneolaceae bacterium]|nr:hypothetical protein [Balneolaceae bacterium]
MAASLIITSDGIWILIEVFIKHLDPQTGLFFLFQSVLQLFVAGIAFGLIELLVMFSADRDKLD